MSKKHKCEYCDKTFSSPQSKCNHKTIKHKNYVPIEVVNNSNVCTYCNKEYSNRSSLNRHLESYCKTKTQLINKIINEKKEIYENLIYPKKYKEEKEILKLKIKLQNDNEIELNKTKEKNIHLEEIINKLSLPMNNQLINIIEDKNKKIVELQLNNQMKDNTEQIVELQLNNQIKDTSEQVIVNQQVTQLNSLTFNNIVIVSRSEDNYINATQLCQAGNKKFAHWFSLDSTKQLINALNADIGIPISGISTLNADTGIPHHNLLILKKVEMINLIKALGYIQI
jgi:hypothetical protein